MSLLDEQQVGVTVKKVQTKTSRDSTSASRAFTQIRASSCWSHCLDSTFQWLLLW